MFMYPPKKTNMEPEKRPTKVKEKHLQGFHQFLGSMLVFRGVQLYNSISNSSMVYVFLCPEFHSVGIFEVEKLVLFFRGPSLEMTEMIQWLGMDGNVRYGWFHFRGWNRCQQQETRTAISWKCYFFLAGLVFEDRGSRKRLDKLVVGKYNLSAVSNSLVVYTWLYMYKRTNMHTFISYICMYTQYTHDLHIMYYMLPITYVYCIQVRAWFRRKTPRAFCHFCS